MSAEKKRFICVEDGYNIYESIDDFGRVHLYAYLNRKQLAHEMFYSKDKSEKQMGIRFFVESFVKRKPFRVTLHRT